MNCQKKPGTPLVDAPLKGKKRKTIKFGEVVFFGSKYETFHSTEKKSDDDHLNLRKNNSQNAEGATLCGREELTKQIPAGTNSKSVREYRFLKVPKKTQST